MKKKLPTYYLSHGGGPWPWIPEMREYFSALEVALKQTIIDHGEKPDAILMISGHWEENEVTVQGAEKPSMIYDYYGFPPHTYEITYDAPGAPAVAARTLELLQNAGIKSSIHPTRGFDHGLYAPMEVMYPEANMPIFQVSMLHSYDPMEHIKIGRALAPLREENIMIVGSGLSFHNLRIAQGAGRIPSAEFDAWLFDAMSAEPEDREKQLCQWENAPSARICHPQADHLVPLFVALGAAENEKATRIFNNVGPTGITVSNYRFGELA
jgi:aromatic ring-opening dioxygenase catalytic subunit (LigB family)